MILVDHNEKLFNNTMCFVGTEFTQVTPKKDFRILIANVDKFPRTFTKGQKIIISSEHPNAMKESSITHGEVLRVAVESLYRRRPCDAKAEDVINKSLAKNREELFGETKEAPITSETVPLSVEDKYHPAIRKMLKKHEYLWSGELGHINVTSHPIVLIL